jgi:hypothetical protein
MRRRALVGVLLATLSGVGAVAHGAPDSRTVPSPAAASPPAAATAEARTAGERALALVARPDNLGYELRFAAARSDVRAQTDRRTRVITVFVRPADAPHRIAHDIAHELGHAWDDRRGTDAGRAAYLRSRDRPGARWWPGGAHADYATGAGDFAEVFARCHAASPEFRSVLAPAPPDACAALRAAGYEDGR